MNYLNLPDVQADYIHTSFAAGVVTILMNKPKKLNGWTAQMMDAFVHAFEKAREDEAVKAVIFTGSGEYYCAGVNLSGTLKIMAPNKLHKLIVERNILLFERFLSYPKPILVAVNGPAIGASVTSATLCDGIIAADTASFSTPFAALGISPEGCSSIQFARLMGEDNAQRMLGEEAWKPKADEALAAGFVQWVVPKERLQEEAQKIAAQWVSQGRVRSFMGGSELNELRAANEQESIELANRFLGADFLKAQSRFLWSKKKYLPSVVFSLLVITRPIWKLML